MKIIAAELLKLAKTVMRTELNFSRSPNADESKLNLIQYEVSRFISTVRKNEGLSTFVNREDDKDRMTLEVGISDHDNIDAIVREVEKLAEKLANKNDIKLED